MDLIVYKLYLFIFLKINHSIIKHESEEYSSFYIFNSFGSGMKVIFVFLKCGHKQAINLK